MKDHGGFDHNEQSLRVVEHLEESYPQHPGLNLSYEVLEGLRKHHLQFTTLEGITYSSPTLEAQIANMADEIAYYSHDLDDGLEAGLLELEELETLTLWQEAKEQAIREASPIVGVEAAQKNRKFILRCLINRQVQELVTSSREQLVSLNIQSVQEVRKQPQQLIQFHKKYAEANLELRTFLYAHFYRHPTIAEANHRACSKIESLFHHFISHPESLGDRFFKRIELDGKHRTVCDYIAGMTDRYVVTTQRKKTTRSE